MLDRAADLFEADRAGLMALMVREAGKTLANAQGDLREAVDHLRYAAAQARLKFAEPRLLKGPTGEENALGLHGRGVFAAISPWNFPLAIFTGQIAGALAAGNAVVAKPAEQTPLIASVTIGLLHDAGIPKSALQLVTGDGVAGAALVADLRIAGVAFTGSTQVGLAINRALAAKDGPIAPLPCLSKIAYRRCPDCKNEATCEIRRVFAKVTESAREVLDRTTIAAAIAGDGLATGRSARKRRPIKARA